MGIQEEQQKFKDRLDEIEAKYKDRELTEEEETERKLQLLKLQKDSTDQFNKVWKSLDRTGKRRLLKDKHKYSSRVKKRLGANK